MRSGKSYVRLPGIPGTTCTKCGKSICTNFLEDPNDIMEEEFPEGDKHVPEDLRHLLVDGD